ncbi:MAG: pilus assembly protein PilZ [Pseudomonadaceae bacterium]|nr:pilus assembly protein PilZ [Pseudomonadaceae bacterium]
MSDLKPLTLVIKDKQTLKAHYMPFLKNGGLFVPTSRIIRPGELIQIQLQLPEQEQVFLVKGTLAWRTPVGAQGQKLAGVGVHFLEDETSPKHYLEELLAGLADNDKPTHTL